MKRSVHPIQYSSTVEYYDSEGTFVDTLCHRLNDDACDTIVTDQYRLVAGYLRSRGSQQIWVPVLEVCTLTIQLFCTEWENGFYRDRRETGSQEGTMR